MPTDTSSIDRQRLAPTERREHLLRFGRSHFAQFAFDALSMQAIAERAGVSKALIYHYFGGQRGFYLATVTHVVDGVLDAMASARVGHVDDELRGMLEAFVSYCEENAGIYSAIIRGGLGADVDVAQQTDRVRQYVIDYALLVTGIANPRPLDHIALSGWIAFAETATATWIDQPEVRRDELVALLLSAFDSTVLATLRTRTG